MPGGMDEEVIHRRRRGVYLLPNLFTTAGLFAGFYGIVAALKGEFEMAAMAIFIAMAMDNLDGRIARLTHTQSAFGVQYDSLADMVSFGIGPALILYKWSLFSMGKLGWLAAFIYTAGAALRLARFNTQVGIADKRYFQGLASPAAAGLVMSLVWVSAPYGFQAERMAWPALVLTVAAGLLMVSNIRYHSFKNLNFKGRVPFVTGLMVVLAFVLISLSPPRVFFLVFLIYAVSGPVLTLTHLRRRRAQRRAAGRSEARPGTK
jgi:CDP-diacylglycerol--serine O-phosphatidyltransferase